MKTRLLLATIILLSILAMAPTDTPPDPQDIFMPLVLTSAQCPINPRLTNLYGTSTHANNNYNSSGAIEYDNDPGNCVRLNLYDAETGVVLQNDGCEGDSRSYMGFGFNIGSCSAFDGTPYAMRADVLMESGCEFSVTGEFYPVPDTGSGQCTP